jgi:hypothetical protein
MITLLIYAPCEKVIVSDENTASVISIMESVGVNVAGDIPADALAPIRWSILSLWKRDQENQEAIEIEERADVLRPDGTVATGGSTKFTVTSEHLFYRTLVHLPVFPIGLPGFVKVRCRTRQTSPETEWRDIAEFPVLVIHHPVKIEANPEGQPVAVVQKADESVES